MALLLGLLSWPLQQPLDWPPLPALPLQLPSLVHSLQDLPHQLQEVWEPWLPLWALEEEQPLHLGPLELDLLPVELWLPPQGVRFQ